MDIRKVVNGYTIGNILPKEDVLRLPAETKLIYLQRTPEKAVKQRKVGNTMVNYVEVAYVERALNFVSNFQRWSNVRDKWFIEYMAATKSWPTPAYEAWVLVDFYIVLWDKRIERACFGSWRAFENPAVSRYSVFSSALSIATKAFGDTLGIGSDKKDIENASLQKAREELEIPTLEDVANNFTTWSSNA